MTPDEIYTNNNIIGQFMGEPFLLSMYGKDEGEGLSLWQWASLCTADSKCFHSSWDWLMPVVHKCLGICHERMLDEWEYSFAEKFCACDIFIMFKEVVEFIQWYNKQKLSKECKLI